MKNVQLNTYLHYLEKKIKQNLDNLDFVYANIEEIENNIKNKNDIRFNKKNIGYSYLFDLTKISNIVYPIKNEDFFGIERPKKKTTVKKIVTKTVKKPITVKKIVKKPILKKK